MNKVTSGITLQHWQTLNEIRRLQPGRTYLASSGMEIKHIVSKQKCSIVGCDDIAVYEVSRPNRGSELFCEFHIAGLITMIIDSHSC